MSIESTVDIIAASGPAMKTPAQKGDISFTVSVGTARSPISIPGMTALPIAPIRCIASIVKPTAKVPITIALCIDFESLYPRHFCVVWGSPSIPNPTSTQNDRIKGFGMEFPAPPGVRRSGSIDLRVSMMFATPPPAEVTAKSSATDARSIMMPWIVSVRTTALKPPMVV